MNEEDGDGWRPWRIVPRVAGGAVSVPVVVGFVVLGACVVLARSLREVARETWSLIPSRRSPPETPVRSDSNAA